ncbi:hypothetical protein [Thermoanaerobacterium sp. R66]|uniref:hypothetical protein n=1 Tax=Thermoanaerobacterium sp. R66 TaxID=2742479 RepID=UPI0023804A0F|nr:hypothetical protein [Thermoanaerobacterium sp. R66]MDE4541220.1 hypothetical protein [Thermoanaerobacterium sp. R66]
MSGFIVKLFKKSFLLTHSNCILTIFESGDTIILDVAQAIASFICSQALLKIASKKAIAVI